MISVCNRTFLRSFKVCKVAWVSVPKSGSGQNAAELVKPDGAVCPLLIR